MSNNWPDEIEEKLILSDEAYHKVPYSNPDGIKEKFHAKKKVNRRIPKRILILAATLLITSMSALAGKNRWFVTNPGTYEGDYVKVEQTKHVSFEHTMEEESTETTTKPVEDQTFDDKYFLAQTEKTIKVLSGGEVDLHGQNMTIQYQTNEIYERAEAEVLFQLGGKGVSVKFDRESGYLIGISYWPGEDTDDIISISESDLVFTAMDWYEKLPFPQGYQYSNTTKIDQHMWFYDFSRQVELEIEGEMITLANPYETVRIGLDPCNGALVLSNVFYIPLLDDHEDDMKALEKEEALEIAIEYYGKLRNYTDAQIKGLLDHATNGENNLKDIVILANVGIELPRYETLMEITDDTKILDQKRTSTEDIPMSGKETEMTVTATTIDKMISYRSSKVSRLAWKVTFEDNNRKNIFADRCDIAVDLYTGEVISVENTK